MHIQPILDAPIILPALGPDFEIHMAGTCSRSHIHKKNGDICNGTCCLEFGHGGKDSCGTCGEDF